MTSGVDWKATLKWWDSTHCRVGSQIIADQLGRINRVPYWRWTCRDWQRELAHKVAQQEGYR